MTNTSQPSRPSDRQKRDFLSILSSNLRTDAIGDIAYMSGKLVLVGKDGKNICTVDSNGTVTLIDQSNPAGQNIKGHGSFIIAQHQRIIGRAPAAMAPSQR